MGQQTVGEIYHIYNRGVEKRNIFMKDSDRIRFLYSLLVFNNMEGADSERHSFEPKMSKLSEVELRSETPLVKILAFVLMPNHYHLMIEKVEENGITEFMRKVGTGYTNYFNKKYDRVGPLFQGKFKSVIVKEQQHFIYLPYYIHLNPLSLIEPEWKNSKILKNKETLSFLENYPWSSHMDYSGRANIPNLLDMNFLNEVFGSREQYQSGIVEWLEESSDKEIKDLILEN